MSLNKFEKKKKISLLNLLNIFKISFKIYNVISNGLINNTNNNAQSSKMNNNDNKLTVQKPSANVS
jgi:hypothetical protein